MAGTPQVIVRLAHDVDGAIALIGAHPMPDTLGVEADAAIACADSALFEILENVPNMGKGRVVGAFALQVHDFPSGRELVVTAAAGRASVNLADELEAWLTMEAARLGADVLSFQTARPGLVRRALRRGFAITSQTLSKRVVSH